MKYFQIKGSDEVIKQFKRLPGACLDASAVGQFNAAQVTMELSKTRAPYEHGDLENSAFVDLPRITAFAAIVDLGYFGIPYIARQHEETSWQHRGTRSTTDNPARADAGKARFLATAVQETEKEATNIIAKAVDYFIRTGKLPAMKGSIKGKQ